MNETNARGQENVTFWGSKGLNQNLWSLCVTEDIFPNPKESKQ